MLDHPALRRWLDRSLSVLEHATVDRLRLAPKFPPLFVVGPPRSGTTALFLTLVNRFCLSFVPNLSKRHPRAAFCYALLGSLKRSYQPTLGNRFGIVDQPMAPSDGWDLFLRWFPNAYLEAEPCERARELRTLVRLFEWLQRGPFCVRNNVNSLRIRLLETLFPNAIFVGITRDYREAALSLREAYLAHHTPAGQWWSAGPPGYEPARFESELEKAVFQILGVEAILRRDLARRDPGRTLLIRYEAFCADPEAVLAWTDRAYARQGVALRSRRATTGGSRARRSNRRLSDPQANEMDRYCGRFLRGAGLRSERVLSASVRALVEPGA